jgi:DNA modification methylase
MTHPHIENRRLDALIPYARNARTHSDEQVAQIAASIREFGFTNPVLIDENGGIIAGHGRVMAARKLGMAEVPCIRLSHLTEAQRRAYIIADNKLALNAGWDEQLLAIEIEDLKAMDFNIDLLGFAEDELNDLLSMADAVDEGNTDADDVPEPQAEAVTKPGDVWILGRHRLICSDSANVAAIESFMAGERAALLFTSPPYANQRNYTTGGIADWDALMRGVFGAAAHAMREDGQILVNLGLIHRDNEVIPYWDGWLDWMRSQGWRRFGWYVWDQGPGLPGDWTGRLAPSHEFIFHFNRQSRKPNKIVPCKFAGEEHHGKGLRGKDGAVSKYSHDGMQVQDFRIPDSVIRVTRHKARGIEVQHPAVFPVALPEFVIEAYTDAGDIVFEPFGGSGTTIIAAEQTGRRCYAMELSPQYVDVAVRRWQSFTGKQARLSDSDRTFADIEADRKGTHYGKTAVSTD